MYQKTKGIIIRTIKYNDSSNIIDVYTELFGRISFIVSIPSSRRSNVKMSLFQPLSIVEIEVDVRPTRSLSHVKSVRSSYPFSSILFDQRKLSMAFFIAEFLLHALREESGNHDLFDYLKNSIMWLDNSSDSYTNFHLVFLMHLSVFLGFYPNLQDYHRGDYFDLQNSCFVGIKPLHLFFLESEEAVHILTMMRMNYNNMHLFQMSRSQRNRCIEIMIRYYRIHLPEFPELKSLGILRDLFD